MYTGIKHFHSGLAYLLLAGLVAAIIYAIASRKKSFTAGSRKIALVGLICAHLQFLLGLVLYFLSPLGASNFSGDAMKEKVSRLYIIEHPLMMLIAVVLVTIGYSRIKRLGSDPKKYSSIIVFYGIGLLLMLSVIPWNVWP
ncbi:hypothetical protein [Agriterribacter sp.]|uniref:hypothetical protein n=1 Tax=Agriterribacter sp. TaxID=2821509 RepID=UPI002CE37984|nr:hypothetical protein [Agriterribacter sp.]HRP57871.1 hypothetical protein [Agriterribacter sp.]